MRLQYVIPALVAGVVLLGGTKKLPAQSTGGFTWQKATPESQGMSSEKLQALQEDLAKRNTRNFLVIRNDKIVMEWYADGRTASDKHSTASLA